MTDDDPPIVDCAFCAADFLIAISEEVDIEDADNDGVFRAGAHAASTEVPNITPSKN